MSHAALEFAIKEICGGGRFDDLARLIGDDEIVALEGDPGWSLERRGPQDSWPAGAEFRAFVDPEEFQLPEPENFYSRTEFADRVLSLLNERFAVSHEMLVEARRARTALRAELAPLFESLMRLGEG
jgi:hypothetical protein